MDKKDNQQKYYNVQTFSAVLHKTQQKFIHIA